MIATYERLRPVGRRADGVPARGDLVLRLRASPSPSATTLVRILDIVEKPEARGGAVEPRGDGPLRVHAARSSTRSSSVKPGVGGEIQLTDAIALLLADQTVYGYVFSEGRYDIGKKLDYLRATVELAIDREDLGPEFRAFLVELVQRRRPRLTRLIMPLVPLDEARGSCSSAAAPLDPVVGCRSADALGLRAGRRRASTPRAGAAVRQHGDGRLRRARRRRVGASSTRRSACTWWAPSRPGTRPTSTVGPGEAVRIMTGAPMPDGRRRGRDGRAHDRGGRRRERRAASAEAVRAGQPRPPGRRRPRSRATPVFGRGEVLDAGHLGVLAERRATDVRCVRRPRVGVLSTGDELVADGGPLAPGQIRDSNRLDAARALLAQAGCDGVDLGLVRDDEAAIDGRASSGAERRATRC